MPRRTAILFPVAVLTVLLASSESIGQAASVVSSKPDELTPADSTAALDRLESDLNRLLDLPKERSRKDLGVKVISLATDRELFALNASKPLTPASATKIVTAYSALLLFGSDYGIPTILYGDGNVRSGTLRGDLYIRGHGDPTLSVGDIDELVDQLQLAGIARVDGNIVGDGTYFDGIFERKEYSGDADHVVDLPPVSGLAIENNVVTIVVSSPREPGKLCNVQTFPPSSGFTIVNSTSSYGKSRRHGALDVLPKSKAAPLQHTSGRLGDRREELRTGYYPDNLGVSIDLNTDDDGNQVVRVSGRLRTDETVSRRFEIPDPPLTVAGMLFDRLQSRGIEVTGTVETGRTPASAKPITEVSRPLVDVLTPVLKSSHNYYAEYVFKMIGAATGGGNPHPTAEMSRSSIAECMGAAAVPFADCKVNDGSGLSRRNLIAPETLVAILRAAWHNRPLWKTMFGAMSIAGVDGTLRKRMRGTSAQGNVRAKTGTLRNVSALTGYVTTQDGERLAFAILTNGYGVSSYKSVENDVAVRLADFSWKDGAR